MKTNRFVMVLILSFVVLFSASFKQQSRQERDSRQRFRRPPQVVLENIPRSVAKAPAYAQDHILVKFDPSLSTQNLRSTLASYRRRLCSPPMQTWL